MKEEVELKIEGQLENPQLLSDSKDLNEWKEKIVEEGSICWHVVQQALKIFCLKPAETSEIMKFLLLVNPDETIKFIIDKKSQQKLPSKVLLQLIEIYFQ